MRSVFSLLATTACVCSFAASASAGQWATTATQAVPVLSLLGATDLGAAPLNEKVTLRLGLALHNEAALKKLVRSQSQQGNPNYEQYLTPAQFAASYAPTSSDVSAVTQYLTSMGFSDIVVEPNNLLITATGTVSAANAAFNTVIEKISVGGVGYLTNLTGAQVPQNLGSIVVSVLGLNTIGHMASPLRLPSLPQYLVSYTPAQFQKIYSASSTAPASNASIAIMAEGDVTGVITDLHTAEAAFGLPQVPVTVRHVGAASGDTSGADEWDMDTQYSSGMAQDLKKLYIYDTTSLSDSDLAVEFSRFASDDLAKAGSASLGECEIFPYIDGAMTIDDEIFLEAAAQGQSFLLPPGIRDRSAQWVRRGVNGVPIGAPLVNYPAASPYGIGVGGTTLLTKANGAYDYETAWVTTGGGLSQFESSPAWQQNVNLLINTGDIRGVPDVAMDADPESGADVYVNGKAEGVGGTSLSAPLALGVWARAVSANPKLGNAGPRLYKLYKPGVLGLPGTYPRGGYHDITLGANGLYAATPGYDFTTGLGTFFVSQLVRDLSN